MTYALEKLRRWTFCALLVLGSALAFAESPCTGNGKSAATANATVFTVEYCNEEYGYRVILDQGLKVYGALPPAPNHGFGVNLRPGASSEQADVTSIPYLWVDASYNAMDLEDQEAVTDWKLNSSCKHGRAKVDTTDMVELDEIPGDFVRLSCPADGTVREFASVYRKERNVIYTVEVVTTLSQLKESEAAFKRVVANFRFMEMPQP